MARPPKDLNWDDIEKMCQIMCTHQEIAHICSTTVDTLDTACKRQNKISFSEYYEQKSSFGKLSLRRKQFAMAMGGDRVMLIWLGKQMLNQIERTQIRLDRIPEEVFLEEAERRLIESKSSENS